MSQNNQLSSHVHPLLLCAAATTEGVATEEVAATVVSEAVGASPQLEIGRPDLEVVLDSEAEHGEM